MARNELSARELIYINGVVSGQTKRAAAKAAGYRGGDRSVEILTKRPRVTAEIERRLFAAAQTADISREEIVRFHADRVRGLPRVLKSGRVQQTSLKHSLDSAKELRDMNGWGVKGEPVEPMHVSVDMGFDDEMLEILDGSGTEAEKMRTMMALVRSKLGKAK